MGCRLATRKAIDIAREAREVNYVVFPLHHSPLN
jgi:hypothetical protein